MAVLDQVKTNSLINLINEQNDIDKIYLHAKELSEPKYEYLIQKREGAGIEHLNNPNAFIECSNTMDHVYENINDYNPTRKRKKLIFFYDVIGDIMDNKKIQAIIKELFIRCRKCSKRCKIKYNTLFHHENKQQKRITKYCN